MTSSLKIILTVLGGFIAIATITGLLAGAAYGFVALAVGAVIVVGVLTAGGVSKHGDAPFAGDERTPLGDSDQHSAESSAVDHPPR